MEIAPRGVAVGAGAAARRGGAGSAGVSGGARTGGTGAAKSVVMLELEVLVLLALRVLEVLVLEILELPGSVVLEVVELETRALGAESVGGPPGAASQRSPLSPQHLREWLASRTRLRSRTTGAGGTAAGGAGSGGAAAGGTGAGCPRAGAVDPRVGDPGAGGAGSRGAATGGTRAGGPRAGLVDPQVRDPGAGGAGFGGATAGGLGAGVSGVAGGAGAAGARPGGAGATGACGAAGFGAGGAGAGGAGAGGTGVGGAGARGVGASACSLAVSSLPDVQDPESDMARAAHPTVTRLLATVVTDPSFESAAASALVSELVDFAAACRLDFATSLVAKSQSVCPPSVRGECALGTDVLEDRQEDFECLAAAAPHLVAMLLAPEGDPNAPDILTPRSYAEAIVGEHSSQCQISMDAEMASWKSTGTYVDAVPPPGANVVDGMWIFKVKWPLGSLPGFKARYVARGFSQRQGVLPDLLPHPKMTTLRYCCTSPLGVTTSLTLSTSAQCSYKAVCTRRPPAPPTWLHWVVLS
ncbi:unnamed protein product [Closterium sp. NIES-65]|nr:unnamed protein product [Closterium sp. NIES-65]